MKYSVLSFFLMVTLSTFAQKEVGYLIGEKDEKIIFYENPKIKKKDINNYEEFGDVGLSAQFLYYYDKQGKLQNYPQSKIIGISTSGKVRYELLPIKKSGMKRLHRVLIENDKYLFTEYYANNVYVYYVFSKSDGKIIKGRKMVRDKAKADKKFYEENIKPYFGNCKDLMTHIENKLNSDTYGYYTKGNYVGREILYGGNLLDGVSNYQCY